MRLDRLGNMEIYGGGSGREGEAVPSGHAQDQCWPGCRTNPQSSNGVNHNSNYHCTAVRNVVGGDADDGDDHYGGGGDLYDDGSSRSPLVTAAAARSYLLPSSDSSPTTRTTTNTTINSRSRHSCSRKIGSHLRLLTFIALVLLTQLTVNISIGEAASQILNKAEPLFITRSEAFKFAVGDTIALPCEVSSPGSYMLAWKRGIAILTAGSTKVTPDPRVRLVNGYTLQILDASQQDAGDYICQMATMNPREITHHVEILVPPKITHVTSGGHLQVRKGSPVRLECSATGNPMPNITWTRKNNVLENGEAQYTSSVYTIENMDRHKGGTYICTANNGVGQVATSQIILHVLYPPEIAVENPIVYSGEGQEAMLVCIVHGESQPEVVWHKDTMQIDQTERHVIESRGARHTLIIRKVHPQDFGNYSCIADNQLGKTRKTVTLTGKPKAAVFRSMPNSQWKDRYNISWVVDSHSPIEEFKLYYRLVDGDILQTHDGIYVDERKSHHPYVPGNMLDYDRKITSFEPYSYNNAYNGHGMHRGTRWSKTDWRDVVLPAFPYSHHYTQGMSYLLRGLDPDQQYEARVQSRNRYGWSDFSDSFLFTTSNTDTEIRDLSVTHRGGSNGGARLQPNAILSWIIPLALVMSVVSNLRISRTLISRSRSSF
ncbi:hemicentin-1 [Aedes aegypti]|uniref:Ig-like domain-containing protein n=1 Tax=Aedes aegypti TaxID=7159 RepID=A0A6I8TUU7_AEDAE|nr:hemicentin-1 [Aedes aegypti]XP_021711306.1 hemicentin-1 [Aedes aegypti]XP_021711307.1 hemicentin-1 [Aedes aegypti]XP_021711308.1 hemicentin-1 [Aedes aegypti]